MDVTVSITGNNSNTFIGSSSIQLSVLTQPINSNIDAGDITAYASYRDSIINLHTVGLNISLNNLSPVISKPIIANNDLITNIGSINKLQESNEVIVQPSSKFAQKVDNIADFSQINNSISDFIEKVSTEALIVNIDINSSLFEQLSKNEAVFAETKIIKGIFV